MGDFEKATGIIIYLDIFGFSEMIMQINKKNQDLFIIDRLKRSWDDIEQFLSTKDGIRYYYLSDSLFVFLKEPKNITERYLGQAFHITTKIQDIYLKNGMFTRGAIASGEVYLHENVLFGEPIIRAVNYEKICKLPLVIAPYIEVSHYSDNGFFHTIKSPKLIELKENGLMNGYIILPNQKTSYKSLIKEYFEYYTNNGPFKYGKYWHDTLSILDNYS